MEGGNVTDDGGETDTVRGIVWDTAQNPALNNNQGSTSKGSGTGDFTSNITDLSSNTTYYVRAYATNSEGTAYGNEVSFTTLEAGGGGVTDIDGNIYETIIIGDQEWMAENLKATKYRNGDAIPTGLNDTDWGNTTDGAYAIYPHADIDGLNSDAEVLEVYGALYNWYAVDDNRGLCPTGWRVPADEDWTELTDYSGGADVAGGKLKSTRTSPDAHPRWDSPNTDATDEFGFSALPGGRRYDQGNFSLAGYYGDWWSSSENSDIDAWCRHLYYDLGSVFRGTVNKRHGYSVRCLKD